MVSDCYLITDTDITKNFNVLDNLFRNEYGFYSRLTNRERRLKMLSATTTIREKLKELKNKNVKGVIIMCKIEEKPIIEVIEKDINCDIFMLSKYDIIKEHFELMK